MVNWVKVINGLYDAHRSGAPVIAIASTIPTGVYQILALNDEMLRSGCITRDEHDFVRHLQTDKLTRLHGRDSAHPRDTALN